MSEMNMEWGFGEAPEQGSEDQFGSSFDNLNIEEAVTAARHVEPIYFGELEEGEYGTK
jgi:hypothetical protein